MNTPNEENVDMISLNEMVKTVAKEWSQLEHLDKQNFQYEYVIFDTQNRLIYQSKNMSIDSIEEAIKQGQSTISIIDKDIFLGTLVALTRAENSFKIMQWKVMQIVISIGIVQVLLLYLYTFELYHKILRPFEKLKNFTHEVAKGNLDLPLEMDKGHAFGAFSESFDLMREELKIAKKKEYEANQSKKELIASLSHDIKTPITGIKLMSELVELQVNEPQLKEKIHSIYSKAEHINELVTDLFESTLEELGELKVQLQDEYASVLEKMFKAVDYKGVIHQEKVPECMIYMDTMRIEQVINNIISNSYKYADTLIEVSYACKVGYLQVEIKDYGPGVSPEEIPLLFNKFYRGKGEWVKNQIGAGLGLYTSKKLMEKMEGEISCNNVEDGFVIKLLIPLSCAALVSN